MYVLKIRSTVLGAVSVRLSDIDTATDMHKFGATACSLLVRVIVLINEITFSD